MRAASVTAAAAILALTGCGSASTSPHRAVHLTAYERRGRALFVGTCGRCHTLADAGTTGMIGPPLTSAWLASRVEETIADGPGGMPAGLLTGAAAAEVAAYVAAATK